MIETPQEAIVVVGSGLKINIYQNAFVGCDANAYRCQCSKVGESESKSDWRGSIPRAPA